MDGVNGFANLPRDNGGFTYNEQGAKEKSDSNGGEHDTNEPMTKTLSTLKMDLRGKVVNMRWTFLYAQILQ